MQKEIEITIAPEDIKNQQIVLNKLAIALNIDLAKITNHKILKRSIDARSRKVVYRLQVRAYIDEVMSPQDMAFSYPIIGDAKTVIIVGAGPAGLFAALQCLEKGLIPIVVERGRDVKQRRRDLAAINRYGVVNTESN